VLKLVGARQIVLGNVHTCALGGDDRVYCWGSSGWGQIGDGSLGYMRAAPTQVNLVSSASTMAAGDAHNCALSKGTVWCWGQNDHLQLGMTHEADWEPSPGPASVVGASALALGTWHSCALVTDNKVGCWGDNSSKQLGGTALPKSKDPVLVPNLTAAAITSGAGASHTCALLMDGAVRCWGRNHRGQLGNGTMADSAQPVAVAW